MADTQLESKEHMSLSRRVEKIEADILKNPLSDKIFTTLESAIANAERLLAEVNKHPRELDMPDVKIAETSDFSQKLLETASVNKLEIPSSFDKKVESDKPKLDIMGEIASEVRKGYTPDSKLLESYDQCKDRAGIFDQNIFDRYRKALIQSRLPDKTDRSILSTSGYSHIAQFDKHISFNDPENKGGNVRASIMTDEINGVSIVVMIPMTNQEKNVMVYENKICFYEKDKTHPQIDQKPEQNCMAVYGWKCLGIGKEQDNRINGAPYRYINQGDKGFPHGENHLAILSQFNLPWLYNKLIESAEADAKKISVFGRDVLAKNSRQGFRSDLKAFNPKELWPINNYELGMRNVIICDGKLYDAVNDRLNHLSNKLNPPLPRYEFADKPKERIMDIKCKTHDGKAQVQVRSIEMLNEDKKTYSSGVRITAEINNGAKTTTYNIFLQPYSKDQDKLQTSKDVKKEAQKEHSYGHVKVHVEHLDYTGKSKQSPDSLLFENGIYISGWRNVDAPLDDSEILSNKGIRNIPQNDQEILKQVDFDFIFAELEKAGR